MHQKTFKIFQKNKKIFAIIIITVLTSTAQTKMNNENEIVLRKADERFLSDHGWLKSRHTFSFAEHYDPNWSGFSELLVINDDYVAPGKGFGTHPHDNMEIISYVIEGELEHKDSMGNGRIIKAGELQYMSAGSGVKHSEFNPSDKNKVHFLQIWIKPDIRDGEPLYSDYDTNKIKKDDSLVLFAGGEGSGAITKIRQNAEIYFGKISKSGSLNVKASRQHPNTWIHVITGKINAMGKNLTTGDGMGIKKTTDFTINSEEDAEFLVFRLP